MDKIFIDRFNKLKEIKDNAQKEIKTTRGFRFEELINDIFKKEKTLVRPSYRTNDNGREQIDGALDIWHRILLIEVKWVDSNLAASELYSFIGKVENKFHGSLGVFISRKKLSKNFIRALNTGRKQNIIVIHGEDLDEIFKVDSPPISKYIEHCLKLLSYDNLTHFPFKDFAEGYQSEEDYKSVTQDRVTDFIRRYLNNADRVLDTDLFGAYESLDSETKIGTYKYVFENYDRVWKLHSHNYNSFIIYNYQEYFRLLNSKGIEIRGTVQQYFEHKLPSNFTLYGMSEIFDLYADKYENLDKLSQTEFETRLLKQLEEAQKVNHWDKENVITEIVDKLWGKFSTDTIDKLKGIYLYVYMDGFRKDKFAQKRFAKYLVEDGVITQEYLKNWIVNRLQLYLEGRKTVDEGALELFWFTYARLYKFMGFGTDEYKQFVRDKATEIIQKQAE